MQNLNSPEAPRQRIRFVDSAYHEVMTIPDRSNIVLTRFDGTVSILPCTYIDDAHARIGNSVYHMLEFAGIMERAGSICVPEGGTADYYEVYQADIHTDLLLPGL